MQAHTEHINKALSSKGTHPVEVRVEQVVTHWKLSWEITIRGTTMIKQVRRLKILNNQTKFDCTKHTGRKLIAEKVV